MPTVSSFLYYHSLRIHKIAQTDEFRATRNVSIYPLIHFIHPAIEINMHLIVDIRLAPVTRWFSG